MDYNKRLAIIIPTKNEEKYLPYLLDSLEEQTYKNYFLIIADAHSTDKTTEIAKQRGAIVVEGGMPFTGRNNGAEKAFDLGADLLVFIDADIILPNKYFLENSIDEFYDRNLDIAGTLQIPYEFKDGQVIVSKKPKFHIIYGTSNIVMSALEKTKRPMFQVCMFVKPEVHKYIGGFKALEYGEDSKYSIEAREAKFNFGILRKGGKVLISPRRYEAKGFIKSGVPYFLAGFILGKNFVYGKTKKKYFD
jgi:glycosyltransferase involved in cell wall biosynthesis